MTVHEALYFLDALHGYVERNVENRGNWCWPTRALAAQNLKMNRGLYPRDKNLVNSFMKAVAEGKRRGWVYEGGCSPHCHARHLMLSMAGVEALRVMNEHGCAACNREGACGGRPEHFERRLPYEKGGSAA